MNCGPIVIMLVAMLVAGCAATLEPAPSALRVSGIGQGAMAEEDGVRVVASAQAWQGYPDLRGVLTPLLVTIDNGSGRSLVVRFEHFALEGAGGRMFAALPPFEITGDVRERVGYAALPWARFGVAPHLSPYYPWLPVYRGPFFWDHWYYDRYRPVFRRVDLPTGDMIRKALPEGVIAPGGRASGFVYIEDVEDTEAVVFTVQLVDAQTRQRFGTVRIPFTVD